MGTKILIKIDDDLKDLIPNYLKNRNNDIEKCKSSLLEKNYKVISEIGHKIYGNAATYGFIDLSSIGKELEKNANEMNFELLEKNINEFENYLNEIEIEYVKI